MNFFKKNLIHKTDSFEVIYTKISDLKNVKNWEKNRHADDVRVSQIRDKMCKEFPNFVSPSRRPQRQNFNRDNLIELISSLDIDFSQKNIDVIVFQGLVGLNFYAKDYVTKHKISHPSKCDYYNFYLFYLNHEYIKTALEKN